MDENKEKEIVEVQGETVKENTEPVKENTEIVKKEEPKKENVEEKKAENRKGLSIASMVLGIVSLVLFCAWPISIPCAIVGLIFGIVCIRSKLDKKEKNMAIAGIITSSIAFVIGIIIILAIFTFGFISGFSDVMDSDYGTTTTRKYKNNYSNSYKYDYDGYDYNY